MILGFYRARTIALRWKHIVKWQTVRMLVIVWNYKVDIVVDADLIVAAFDIEILHGKALGHL
jgi:hypothetical protein